MSIIKRLLNINNYSNQEVMERLKVLREGYSIQDCVYKELIPYMEKIQESTKEEYAFGKWLKKWNFSQDGRYLFLSEHISKQNFTDVWNNDDILEELREDMHFNNYMQKKEILEIVMTWDEAAQRGYQLLCIELMHYILSVSK